MTEEGVTVRVHPLVLFNIADHYTRTQIQGPGPFDDHADRAPPSAPRHGRVIGALFGAESNRAVEILNSFEISYRYEFEGEEEKGDPAIVFDRDNFQMNVDLYKQIYDDHDVVGWYSTGEIPFPNDLNMHESLQELNDSLLYVMVSPDMEGAREIPLNVYISQFQQGNDDQPRTELVKIAHQMSADEAERVTIDHVAADVSLLAGDREESSTITPHLVSMRNAVASLQERVGLLLKFLRAVQNGEVDPPDQVLLRDIVGVANRLPMMDSVQFDQEFMSDYNDALLVTQLAAMTKNACAMKNVTKKFAETSDGPMGHQGQRRRKRNPKGFDMRGF